MSDIKLNIKLTAYAVVEMVGENKAEIVNYASTRQEARGILREYKEAYGEDFKIIRLKADKQVR